MPPPTHLDTARPLPSQRGRPRSVPRGTNPRLERGRPSPGFYKREVLRIVVEADPAAETRKGARRSEKKGAPRHAAYRSAERTLCLLPLDELVGMRGVSLAPTCPECDEVARAFDKIDRSAPARWYRR